MIRIPYDILEGVCGYKPPVKKNTYRTNQQHKGPAIKKTVIHKADPFTDDKKLADLKALLSKFSEQNKDIIIEKIIQTEIPDSCLEKYSELLYKHAIEYSFLIEHYVEIFSNYSKKNPKLNQMVFDLMIGQFENPREFQDTACEEGVHKYKRYRVGNFKLCIELVRKNLFDRQKLLEFLDKLVVSIKPEFTVGIEILKDIMSTLGPLYQKAEITKYMDSIKEISTNKAYPSRFRFLLMDVLDLYQRDWVPKNKKK